MKKLLTLLLLIVSTIGYSQISQKTSILGVQFGASKASMIQTMKSKGYILKSPNEKNPYFNNVRFGAFNRCEVIFYFVNNKMFQVLIALEDGLDAKAIERYEYLNTELSKKYGDGESFKSFKSPYEDGDGYETSAIKLGKAEFNTFWNKGDLAINSYINSDLLICVKYQDSELVKEALKVKDNKNIQEY